MHFCIFLHKPFANFKNFFMGVRWAPPTDPLGGRSPIMFTWTEIFAAPLNMYLPSLAAPGFWFGGGNQGVTARKAPTQGVRGAKAPLDGSEVSFFKAIQSIRKWIHFSKIEHFFLPENPFFQWKIPKSDIFHKNFCVFLKKYLEFWFLWRNSINTEKSRWIILSSWDIFRGDSPTI